MWCVLPVPWPSGRPSSRVMKACGAGARGQGPARVREFVGRGVPSPGLPGCALVVVVAWPGCATGELADNRQGHNPVLNHLTHHKELEKAARLPIYSSASSPQRPATCSRPQPRRVASCGSMSCMLYGGAQLPVGPTSPVCVCKTPHAPERGVGRPPRNGPPPSEHEV
eukprot:scaffold3721_cov134-Isochrysis_galbana.AAC.5